MFGHSGIESPSGSPAPVDRRGPGGATPLLMAIQNGHVPVAAELLRRGADIEATNDPLFPHRGGHLGRPTELVGEICGCNAAEGDNNRFLDSVAVMRNSSREI